MEACNICKGESKEKCMFCGHKKKKGKKPFFGKQKPKLTNAEIVARDGKREQTMCLNKFSHMSLKFSNCSTQDSEIDKQIEQHRIFGKKLYYLHNVEHKSMSSIADQFDLTVNQVKHILATTLFQINQQAADHPEPIREVVSLKPTEEEIAEIRRLRDMPKPKKVPTFSKLETIYADSTTPHEIGQS